MVTDVTINCEQPTALENKIKLIKIINNNKSTEKQRPYHRSDKTDTVHQWTSGCHGKSKWLSSSTHSIR